MRNTPRNLGRKRRPTPPALAGRDARTRRLANPDTVAEIPSPAADASVDERYDEAIDSALASLSARHRGPRRLGRR